MVAVRWCLRYASRTAMWRSWSPSTSGIASSTSDRPRSGKAAGHRGHPAVNRLDNIVRHPVRSAMKAV